MKFDDIVDLNNKSNFQKFWCWLEKQEEYNELIHKQNRVDYYKKIKSFIAPLTDDMKCKVEYEYEIWRMEQQYQDE